MHITSIQSIFLACMSWVFLWAFASLYHQIPGLYGDNGLLPVSSILKCESDLFECSFTGSRPTILHLIVSWLGVSPSQALELACCFGIILASLTIIFGALRDCISYVALWFLYFSCFQVGQTFLWFQWDTLLVEAGFLAALVAPFKLFRFGRISWLPQDNVTLFLVKWLAFRLIFASGVVKLTSECPTWWGLTALHYHFESQCIPTPLAWFAHQTPDWLKQLSVTATYVLEMIVPLFFLSPVRHHRVVSFWSQVFLMALIMLTGNYNFFNLVYAFVCIPMLLNSKHSHLNVEKLKNKFGSFYTLVKATLIGFFYGAIIYWWIRLFNLRLKPSKTIIGFEITSETAFTKDDLYRTLSWCVPWLMVMGTLCFVAEVFAALLRCFMDFRTPLAKLWAFVQCFIVCVICTVMFSVSLVPFSWLDSTSNDMIWPEVHKWHKMSDKFQLTHSYGLFRSMTGVGGRPEVIIEGANSEKGPWKEYEFLYKIGSLSRRPPVNIPHQPRLDWQMWFAALGSYQRNPWFISLIHKLLNNQKEVLDLMENNPFPDAPPKFIRSHLYLYHFTALHSNSTNWWAREFYQDYMPPITVDNPNVVDFLTRSGLLLKATSEKPSQLGKFLAILRRVSDSFAAPQFVWALSAAICLGYFTKRIVL